jgi:hypothetical protein
MKVLSRDFTTKEKIMLVVFCLLLLALAYYRFFYVPTQNQIDSANAQRDNYQTELTEVMAKEAQILKMKEEIDSLGELNNVSRIESYNNSKAEISLLNSVLEPAIEYSINFSNTTRDGDLIRRNFSLMFRTDTFVSAKRIISNLEESRYRCILGDVQYAFTLRRAQEEEPTRGGRWIDDEYYYDVVTVNTSATFYETMYDGVADAGLPAEEKK